MKEGRMRAGQLLRSGAQGWKRPLHGTLSYNLTATTSAHTKLNLFDCRLRKSSKMNFGTARKDEGGPTRNLTIKLVRHGESKANTGEVSLLNMGDFNIPLSDRGREQAREAGRKIGKEFLQGALIFASPYRRTRETFQEMLNGVGMTPEEKKGLSYYEDPRLREVELGYGDIQDQAELRRRHGWFYYRYEGGESPADCYDRTSNFLESMMRQRYRKSLARERQPYPAGTTSSPTPTTTTAGTPTTPIVTTVCTTTTTDCNKVLVISHGLTIRCFVMRFLHLTVEQFDIMANPTNCDIITLLPKEAVQDVPPEMREPFTFESQRWGVLGLKIRPPEDME